MTDQATGERDGDPAGSSQATAGDGLELDGQVIALTGATSGIGREAAATLAGRGATVAAVGRDEARGRAAVEAAADAPGEVVFHRADLADLDRVRELAEELRDAYDRLDVLAHNAGLSTARRRESDDGIELTLAVNHLAPYLLTHELLDLLQASTPSRVVLTASKVHRDGDLDFDDLQYDAGYDAMDAYARSKLANVAFTVELAERLRGTGVVANCFHPGFVPGTELFRDSALRIRLMTRVASLVPGVGTETETAAGRLVQLVADPEFGERTGCYVADGREVEPADPAGDPATRMRLWRVSAVLAGVDPEWP